MGLANLIAAAIAGGILYTLLLTPDAQNAAVGIVAVRRTVFDYILQWKMYYPRELSEAGWSAPQDPLELAADLAAK